MFTEIPFSSSIKWKLAFAFSLSIFAIIIFMSVFSYSTISDNLVDQLDQPLIAKSYQLKFYIQDNAANENELKDAKLDYIADPFGVEAFDAPKFFVRLVDKNGKEIAKSSNVENEEREKLYIEPQNIDVVINGQAFMYDLHLNKQEALRVMLLPIKIDEKHVAVLQVARSSISVEKTLLDLKRFLFFWGAVAVIIGWLVGYFISYRMLESLTQITNKAKTIEKASDIITKIAIKRDDEIGELAHAFDTMLDRLQDSFRHQQELISNISHELNTPIAIIKMQIDELQSKQNAPDYNERVQELAQEIEYLKSILADIFLLSQIDEGHFSFNFDKVELDELLGRLHNNYTKLFPDHKFIYSPIPAVVHGDRDRLKQLFNNLISNAVKYSPTNSPVEITIEEKGNKIAVSVSDKGIGINENDLNKIFERFYRADKARSLRKGTGIGLSIVKYIADKHNAEVNVTSEVGKGTRFEILFDKS